MTIQESPSDTPRRRRQRLSVSPRSRVHPLHEAALRIADIGLGRSRSRTRDLVALLLCHGARAWRTSQPRSGVRLRVLSATGSLSIRLRLG